MTTTHRSIARALAAATGIALAVVPVTGIVSADDDTGSTTLRTPTSTRTDLTCRGETATHVNEDGTGGDDVIVVTEPSITVEAWAGDDLICVYLPQGEYGAYVHGSYGRDTIITYGGANHVFGGPDGDSILSNSADALLDGEEGDDTIYLGQQPDLTYGGEGDDRIFGSPAGDQIHAGGGDDLVIGFDGDDVLEGGAGNDRLEGRGGTDDLDGQADDDECIDSAAPATTFTSCESIVGLGVPLGPGGIAVG